MSLIHPLFGSSLPKHWKVLRVDEIKSVEPHSCVAGPFGSSISSKYFVENGVPVIRGSNLSTTLERFHNQGFVFVSNERSRKYVPQTVIADDLVFTCWGTIGQVGIVPRDGFEKYIISNKQLKLRVNKKIADPAFVYFYFACNDGVEYVRSHAKGAAVPGISLGILKELSIALPPLPVQRRIASILSAYDDLIENNTRRIAILEEMARRIYEEWFVHFRFPGHEKTSFKHIGHDKIPTDWIFSQLKDYIELVYGKSLRAKDRVDGQYPVYGSSGVIGFHNKYLVEGPGIVVGRKGNVGSIHWVEDNFYPIDTAYYVKTALPLEYVYYNLQRQNFLNNDAAVPGLNRNQAYSLSFICPPDYLLDLFKQTCDCFFQMIANTKKANENLRDQRDLLLPKLISGKIDVSEIEREPCLEVE